MGLIGLDLVNYRSLKALLHGFVSSFDHCVT